VGEPSARPNVMTKSEILPVPKQSYYATNYKINHQNTGWYTRELRFNFDFDKLPHVYYGKPNMHLTIYANCFCSLPNAFNNVGLWP
jgi:hypothetical protein